MSVPTSIKGVLLVDGQVTARLQLAGRVGAARRTSRERRKSRSNTRTRILRGVVDQCLSGRADRFISFRGDCWAACFIVTYGCALVGEFRPTISDEHSEHRLWPVERLSELKLPTGYKRSIEKWAQTI